MSPVKSQVLGLMLGLSTAVGCLFYERLVHRLSYASLAVLWLVEYGLFGIVFLFVFKCDLRADWNAISSDPKIWIWAGLYLLTGITSPLWYYITLHQGVMVGSLYEVKYIVMLAVIYILFGSQRLDTNTVVGVVLAVGSVYCISRSGVESL